MRNRLPLVLSVVLAVMLAGLSTPVAALGLGQIQVLSRSGEPLLAEIPIVSNDPRELEQLQARLASPDTFRRIGLEPPQGAAADLRFAVALDARGNPVVRVTSPAPIDQPLLTFLLEVDWGQGRLVREYSVLVDAPQSAVAVGQPAIEAPRPAPTSTVVRPADAAVVQSEPLPPDPQPAAPPEPAQDIATRPVAPAPQPAIEAPPSGDYGPVQRGQTLSEIASGMDRGGFTLNQSMLAILRANPDAFIDGNINLLREGAVLRMPGRDVLAELSPSEANAVVQAQARTWRERNAPPVVAADAVAAGDTTDDGDAAERGGESASDASTADARLEIVPPAGDGQAPGSRSGTSAGGEGDMVRNELRQAKETLAARDAEVEELRSRLAELEDLQQKQAELLDLKDSELAAVEQRLAEARTDGEAGTQVEAQSPQEAPPSSLPWLFGGILLLMLAGGAWWWQRRRRPAGATVQGATPAQRRNYDTAAMAATLAGAGREEPAARTPTPVPAKPAKPAVSAVPPAAPKPADARPAPAAPAATPPPAPATGQMFPPIDEAPTAPTAMPTWHAGTVPVVGDAPAAPGMPLEAKGQANPTGRDGLELARAYLDLGDHQAARTLLREVLLGRDPNAREEAARLLRELG